MSIPPRSERFAATEHTCDIGGHKVAGDVVCVTPGCPHKGKSWDGDGHQDWNCDYACEEHVNE